jgi:NitT/TauT family transport system permease protein
VAGSGEAQGLAWRVLEAEHQLRTTRAAVLHAAMGLAEKAILSAWRGRG